MSTLLQSFANSKTVYAPNYVKPDPFSSNVCVFLAGSIEMGAAEDWQPLVTKSIEHLPATGLIFNPRRLDFQKDAVQSIYNTYFKEQVDWELDHIDSCNLVFMYFDPNSKSPISLLELGIILASNPHCLIVCCPEGFWRKGNVDITCSRANVKVYTNLDDAIQALKNRINTYNNFNDVYLNDFLDHLPLD